MEKSRQQKIIKKAFESLEMVEYEEAEKEFRRAKCHGGLALIAFLVQRYERAANQALKSLDNGETCFPHEREVALKILKMCDKEVGREAERGPFVHEVEKRLSGVRWEEIEVKIVELARSNPGVFARLSSKVISEEARNENMGQVVAMLRTGHFEACLELLANLKDLCPDDEFLSYGWATHPRLVEEMRTELGKEMFEFAVTHLLGLSRRRIESKEVASLLGLWLSNIASYFLEKGENQKGNALSQEALRCFENAAGLGERSSFLFVQMGFCHEMLKKYKKAVRCYERAFEAQVGEPPRCPTCGENFEPVSISVGGVEKKSIWHWTAEVRTEACLSAVERDFLEQQYHELIERAKQARAAGRRKRELSLLEAALEIRPKDFESLAPRIAELRIKLRRRVGPGFLQEALKLDPKNGLVLNHIIKKGTTSLKRGDPKKAISYFKMVPHDYDDPQFLSKYAQALKEARNYKGAAKLYRKLALGDPSAFHRAAECTFQLGEWDATVKNLEELFSFCESVETLEKGLRLASNLGKEELTSELCQRLLAKDPNNSTAKAIWEKIQSARMDKLRSEYTAIKGRAKELFEQGEHRGVVTQLSKVREEFMDPLSMERMAKSLEKIGKYGEALGWYPKLPGSVETLASMIFCALMEGKYEDASRICRKILEMGDFETLMNEVPYPDVRGFILDELGRCEEALEEYEKEELILRLCEKAREVGDIPTEIMCFKKLYEKFSKEFYGEMMKKLVAENEDKVTVGFKSKVGFDGVEMVICDTNIFFSKLVEELEFPESLRNLSVGGRKIVQKFNELSGKGKRMVLSKTVERELGSLCRGIFEKLEAKYREAAFQKFGEYVRKYGLEEPVPSGDGWLRRVVKFYQQYPEKLQKITEKKIEIVPDERFHLLKKRTTPLLDSRLWDLPALASLPTMPEKADMELLAECLKLNDSHIPGVSRISLFSEDADFKEFGEEIFGEFGIKVYS